MDSILKPKTYSWDSPICFNNPIHKYNGMELNRIIHSVLFLTAGVILTSCIEVNGSGYSDLSESEKLHVKKCEVPLDSITNDGNLYKVSVKQVSD